MSVYEQTVVGRERRSGQDRDRRPGGLAGDHDRRDRRREQTLALRHEADTLARDRVAGDVLRVGDADGDLMVERRRALREALDQLHEQRGDRLGHRVRHERGRRDRLIRIASGRGDACSPQLRDPGQIAAIVGVDEAEVVEEEPGAGQEARACLAVLVRIDGHGLRPGSRGGQVHRDVAAFTGHVAEQTMRRSRNRGAQHLGDIPVVVQAGRICQRVPVQVQEPVEVIREAAVDAARERIGGSQRRRLGTHDRTVHTGGEAWSRPAAHTASSCNRTERQALRLQPEERRSPSTGPGTDPCRPS